MRSHKQRHQRKPMKDSCCYLQHFFFPPNMHRFHFYINATDFYKTDIECGFHIMTLGLCVFIRYSVLTLTEPYSKVTALFRGNAGLTEGQVQSFSYESFSK